MKFDRQGLKPLSQYPAKALVQKRQTRGCSPLPGSRVFLASLSGVPPLTQDDTKAGLLLQLLTMLSF